MVKYSTERTDALLMKLRKGDFYWIVKRLIKDNGKTISEIAEGLGKSQQSLSQKIIKESMRATELYNIADALGYDIVFKKRDNQ